MLIRQYPKYSLIATDPKNYFSYADFSVIRQNNSLLITIQFLISAFQKFELYKIYTFPIPINESSSHATHLQNVPDYLAITFDRQFFVGFCQTRLCLTAKEESVTKYVNFGPMCQLLTVKIALQICFWQIKEQCDFRFFTNDVKPGILHITEHDRYL